MTKMEQLAARLSEATGGRASGLKDKGERVRVMLDIGGMTDDERTHFAKMIDEAAKAEGFAGADVLMTADKVARRLIAVGSGKGGVGKSTLSANLAVALAAMGRKTGLVDADIYGPSQATLLANADKPKAAENKLIPVTGAGGVPFLSMGQLSNPGQPIAWRGPMVSGALGQMIEGDWGAVCDLVIDLPPGTGDIQLTMVQKHKPVGAVIVTTPQDLALIDATRAIAFFQQAGVPVIGVVENMAGYACPHCGEVSDPFGSGGAEATAKALGLPFLGRIPLDLSIRSASDAGHPPALDDTVQGAAFRAIATQVAAWVDQNAA